MKINNNLDLLETNIIRWYPFKENSKILLIGDNFDEINIFLSSKYIVKYYKEDNIVENEKYNYIIIKDDIYNLKKYKGSLEKDGTILLLLNNRWGVNFFARSDGFKDFFNNSKRLLNRFEIENLLKENEFYNYKFFYPLPNYEFSNVIYSDDYLPKYTDSKIANNNFYESDVPVFFSESDLLRIFAKNGDFVNFTNSFLIEINPKSQEKAIFFNNTRKKEYRIITKMYSSTVEKESYSEDSKEHIKVIQQNIEDLKKHKFNLLDSAKNDIIISKFVDIPNMYEIIVKEIAEGNIDNIVELINTYYQYIKSKFEIDKVNEINKEYFGTLKKDNLFIVKKLYIDLVLENVFLNGQDIYVYDQEWFIENCPIEFLLFRTINNIYMMNSGVNNIISREKMLEKFGILEYQEEFFKAEDVFQNKVIDEKISKIIDKENELIINRQELLKAKENAENLELYKVENEKKEKFIIELQSSLGLNNAENLKKEKYILNLQKEIGDLKAELGLYKAENVKKEKYILELQKQIETNKNN